MRNLLSPIWQRVPPSTFLEIEKTSSPHHTNMCRPCLFFPRGVTTPFSRSDLTKLAVSLSGNPKIHVSKYVLQSLFESAETKIVNFRTFRMERTGFYHSSVPHWSDFGQNPAGTKISSCAVAAVLQSLRIFSQPAVFYTYRNMWRNVHKKPNGRNDSAKTSSTVTAFP